MQATFSTALLVYIAGVSVWILYLLPSVWNEGAFVDDASMDERFLEGPEEIEHAWQELQLTQMKGQDQEMLEEESIMKPNVTERPPNLPKASISAVKIANEVKEPDSPLSPLSPEHRMSGEIGYQYTKETPLARENEAILVYGFNEIKYRGMDPISLPANAVPSACKSTTYDHRKLPQTSVIIVFYNEAWSVLERMVHCLLDRTPAALLVEIILVDDASTHLWLKQDLPRKVQHMWPAKVRLIRSKDRTGPTIARMKAARAATGSILTFLEPKSEVQPNWYEPLAKLLSEDQKVIVSPVIDTIDLIDLSFVSRFRNPQSTSTFNWALNIAWTVDASKTTSSATEPLRSAVLPSASFSISRSFFFEIGGYDEGFRGTSLQDMELSFKTWMCGGSILISRCSHLGKIQTQQRTENIEVLNADRARLSQIWLSDFSHYVDEVIPEVLAINVEDWSATKKIQEGLSCHSFDWYLTNVATSVFIPKSSNVLRRGMLQSGTRSCLDKMGQSAGGNIGLYSCHGQGLNQHWIFSIAFELRTLDDLCLEYSTSFHSAVILAQCHGKKGSQFWHYVEQYQQVRHVSTGLCLSDEKTEVQMLACDGSERQKWTWIWPKDT